MISRFHVKKLDCHSCALVIEGICEDVDGVKKAEVRPRERRLVVEHDQSVNPEELRQALDRGGYPVEIEPTGLGA